MDSGERTAWAGLVVVAGVVRNSAFLFGAGGERVAIVANFDTSLGDLHATKVNVSKIGRTVRLAEGTPMGKLLS